MQFDEGKGLCCRCSRLPRHAFQPTQRCPNLDFKIYCKDMLEHLMFEG